MPGSEKIEPGNVDVFLAVTCHLQKNNICEIAKEEALKRAFMKVLHLMTLQINELCSRRQPLMLRTNTKEGIMQYYVSVL